MGCVGAVAGHRGKLANCVSYVLGQKQLHQGHVLRFARRYFVSIDVNDTLILPSFSILVGDRATQPVDLVERSTGDPSDPSKMGSYAKVVKTLYGLALSRPLPVRQARHCEDCVVDM